MAVKAHEEHDLLPLWQEYKQTKSILVRNRLIEANLHLVDHAVNKIFHRGMVRMIDRDSLQAAGNFGLIQAVEAFDLDRGFVFATYAPARIRGAIIDWLREIDWVPRLVRSNASLWRKALTKLQTDTESDEPTVQQMAAYLHISEDKALELRQDALGLTTHILQEGPNGRGDDFEHSKLGTLSQIADPRSCQPLEELTRHDDFAEMISCLTDLEQIILTLYFRDCFTMLKIGLILGLSESRISQMHTEALVKVKDSLS